MRNFLFIIILLSLFSCSVKDSEKASPESNPDKNTGNESYSLTVGFSQMNHVNPWRVAETNDLKREAAEHGVKLIITDAESSKDKQISDITFLIAEGADYIVCSPLVYTGYSEAFRICREAGVPLIMLDREVDGKAGEDFLTFVGSDFVEEAVRAAEWLAEETGGKAKIIELQGREGASCVFDRNRGFNETIETFEGMTVVLSKYAEFERIKGQQVMEDIILSYGRDFNAVYAHNDEMAIGAIQALKAADIIPGKDVTVVSIDGSKDAMKSIIAGELGATVECTPLLAKQVFNAIDLHLQGKEVPHKIIVNDRLFNASNALEYIDEAF